MQLSLSFPLSLLQPEIDYWNYVVDHIFSQFIIVSLVVTAWRGLWNVLNDLVLPAHFVQSNAITWGAGALIGAILFALERPLCSLSVAARRRHFCKY